VVVSWLVGGLAFGVVGCSSSSPSPNKTPGQCVLSNGTWYCGGAYGNYAQCPSDVGGGVACDSDAGECFDCSDSAGASCVCGLNDAGAHVWICEPTGTGCHL
jgi:hypothetical protein